MFTGIVEGTGKVAKIAARETCHRMLIETDLDISDARLGESISVNGVCLTIVNLVPRGFEVDVALESLKITTLGKLRVGTVINLERALRITDRLGGHLVQGHVDAVGTVRKRETYPEGELWVIEFPERLRRYFVKKGSICVDGVSLTLNEVTENTFEIYLIPHTLAVTNLGEIKVGDGVNLEVDVLGKYIETLLANR